MSQMPSSSGSMPSGHVSTGYDAPDYSVDMPQPAKPGGTPPKRPTKTVYPDITLRGAAADALIGSHTAGDTFTAEVQFKVTGLKSGSSRESYDESGPGETRVELEILSMQAEEEPDGDESGSGEESSDSAIDSYRASRSAAAPAEEEE